MGIVHEMLRFEKQNRLILEFLNLIAVRQIYQNVLAHLLNPYLHRIGYPLHEVADSACALLRQMTMSALSDELAQVRTKKKEFLAQIERIVPWKEWLTLIQPCYYKGERGNKPYPLETMLRLYLLQNLYDLSDEATAAEAIDSRAFSDFCGVDSSNQVP